MLEVEGLRVGHAAGGGAFGSERGRVQAVEDVTLYIVRGETMALVGESGCGKTTLARAVLRLIPTTSGSIRFDGEDVLALRREGLRQFRRRAQMVFQDPQGSLNPRMSVGSALAEVLRVHGIKRTAADVRAAVGALLERVGLGEQHRHRLPHELSGGQRQRVGIARALAVEPELLVLDEPVSSLDVSIRAQVVNLLVDLQKELGLTYLLIAHDLALVEHVADRVAVMYRGRIVEQAPVPGLFRDPKHPYTRALLAAIPQPVVPTSGPARTTQNPDSYDHGAPAPDTRGPEQEPRGCPYRHRCEHPARDAECAAVLPALRPLGDERFVACVKES
jgi:oligopeptide/dipeptide ABC transporter ATP-binding protein